MLSLSPFKDDHWCFNVFLSLEEVFRMSNSLGGFFLMLGLTKFPLRNDPQILLQGLNFCDHF